MRNNVDACFASFFSNTARLSLYLSSSSDVELLASYAKEVVDLLNSDLGAAAVDDKKQAKKHNRRCPSREGDRHQNTGRSPNNLNGRQDDRNIQQVFDGIGQQTSANVKVIFEESHRITENSIHHEPLLGVDHENSVSANCRETRSTCCVVVVGDDGRVNKTTNLTTSLSTHSSCKRLGPPSMIPHGDGIEQECQKEIAYHARDGKSPPVFVPQLKFPDSILRYPACVLVIDQEEKQEGKGGCGNYIKREGQRQQQQQQQQLEDSLSSASSAASCPSSLRAFIPLRSTSSGEGLENNIGMHAGQRPAVHDDLNKASSMSSSRSHYSSSPSLNIGCDVLIQQVTQPKKLVPEVHVQASSEGASSASNYCSSWSSCTSNKPQNIFLRVIGDPKRRRRQAERRMKRNSGNSRGFEVAFTADDNAVRLSKQTGYPKPKSVDAEKGEEEPKNNNDPGDSSSDLLLIQMTSSNRVLSKEEVQPIRSAWAELEGDRSLSFETI